MSRVLDSGQCVRRGPRARSRDEAPRRTGASGTRKIAPADARSAFGPVGSAQPAESATPAPNASAVRSSVPTLPGIATCQSASVSGRAPLRQVSAPVDPDHARRVRRASRAPRRAPAPRPRRRRAARRARSPRRRRPRRDPRPRRRTAPPSRAAAATPSSRRISFSFGLCADVITTSTPATRRGSRRARRTRARAPGYGSIRMPQP